MQTDLVHSGNIIGVGSIELECIESHLVLVEKICAKILTEVKKQEREQMKSYHWVTVAVVLIVAYLIGVKYPSIGQSALSKIGL